MKVEFRDDKTIVITPEIPLEHVLFHKFKDAKVSIENARPFEINADKIIVQVPQQ